MCHLLHLLQLTRPEHDPALHPVHPVSSKLALQGCRPSHRCDTGAISSLVIYRATWRRSRCRRPHDGRGSGLEAACRPGLAQPDALRGRKDLGVRQAAARAARLCAQRKEGEQVQAAQAAPAARGQAAAAQRARAGARASAQARPATACSDLHRLTSAKRTTPAPGGR